MSAHNFEDLTGNIYGHLTVIRFNKNTGKWICRCDCDNKTIVEKKAGHLKLKDRVQSCGCANKKRFIDISGQRFEHLVVKEYSKEFGEWICECDCGRQVFKKSGHLRSGHVTYCGFEDCDYKLIRYSDLTNKRFGRLVAIKQVGQSKWMCKCDCNSTKIVRAVNLVNGSTTSCGCLNPSKQIDIHGQKFGHLKVLEHLYRGIWLCQCDCKNICEKSSYDLRNGRVTSCGCLSKESGKELELVNYIESIYSGEIIRHDKSIMDNKELDVYIPEKSIAFEFNGNYWHSLKDSRYHQEKTIECARKGIHLIHIFEYEWDDELLRDKLKTYIHSLICDNKDVVYARKTIIKEISNKETQLFLNKHHFQGNISSSINIGCLFNNKIVGVIAIGKPRFNNNYQYELHRMCWLPTVIVIGGLEKLFGYFLNKYNPQSIITYCDLSKFTGNSYLKIGFKPIYPNPITKPNYVWVSHHGNDVKKRYQTQKSYLVSKGLGDISQTEVEIMKQLNYFRIHDCGNIRLEWRS